MDASNSLAGGFAAGWEADCASCAHRGSGVMGRRRTRRWMPSRSAGTRMGEPLPYTKLPLVQPRWWSRRAPEPVFQLIFAGCSNLAEGLLNPYRNFFARWTFIG